ncbi:MFS transporter [Erwinia sp. AnSW2-5]|uniref:MFS transporter n=1 Tax=Erwinia sp. AnSW2-5 TaxID=3367692 RepID=UPI00385E3B3A
MKNTYIPTAAGLYLNYLVHGMGVLLMTLNMSHLEQQWQTNAAGVSVVISSLGFGRLVVLFVSGMLSDKFGRKPFIYLGMLCYLGFFFGILSSQSITTAFAFGFLAGMANSFLDSGTYPALMESFPNSASTANILIKAFVSGGQFLLPFIISAVIMADLWFGWSFVIAAAIMLVNAIYLLKRPFPDHRALAKPASPTSAQASATQPQSKSNLLDIACFTLYGYISMATFYLVSQWLAQYGQFVAGMPYASAIKLLSIYTVGSLSCVFVTAALVKKAVSSVNLLMIYTFISLVALLGVCLHPTPAVVMGFAFVIGFSAAGGVMQLGLTIMAMSFPHAKGKATGIFYSAGSLATFTIPLITAKLSQTSIASIMWFDVGIAAAGFALALFIGYRQLAARSASLQVNRVQA